MVISRSYLILNKVTPSFYHSCISSENQFETEIDHVGRVTDRDFLSILQQISELDFQVLLGLLLQLRWKPLIERPFFRPHTRLLQLRLSSLSETLDEGLQRHVGVHCHFARKVSTHRAIRFLLRFERVCVDTLLAGVHHVIFQVRVARCGYLQRLRSGRGCDNGISRGNSGDDVLHHSLRHLERHSVDMELVGPLKGSLVDPTDVLHIVAVEGVVFSPFRPSNLMRPFDAVLRLSGNGCNGTKGNSGSRGMHIKLTFNARRERRQDNTSLTLESYTILSMCSDHFGKRSPYLPYHHQSAASNFRDPRDRACQQASN